MGEYNTAVERQEREEQATRKEEKNTLQERREKNIRVCQGGQRTFVTSEGNEIKSSGRYKSVFGIKLKDFRQNGRTKQSLFTWIHLMTA